MDIEQQYQSLYSHHLVELAANLEEFMINRVLKDSKRIDRVSARAKSVSRFVEKATSLDDSGNPKYDDPLNQIQDQIGVRIVTFYKQDVAEVAQKVSSYLSAIEVKDLEPETDDKFGYFGKHFILPIPSDVMNEADIGVVPKHFELQVKTLFEHAWAEANHDLAYKQKNGALSAEEMRMIAYAAAQAWGADKIFADLAKSTIFDNIQQIS